MGKIYLASPYTHKDPLIRKWRYHVCNRMAAILMLKGYIVFSPISHTVPIADVMDDIGSEHIMSWPFWRKQDFAMLEDCTTLLVLCMDGWKASIGVQAEIKYAVQHNITIVYYSSDKIAKTLMESYYGNDKQAPTKGKDKTDKTVKYQGMPLL